MKIAGTGVDLIEVERIRHALEKPVTGPRLRERIFTQQEVSYCESRGRGRYQSYAARFAAKEAVMKALGTGWNRNVGWRDIEVTRKRGAPPQITLHGKAAIYATGQGVAAFHLSITHTAGLAMAHVIAQA